jgi:hypothetical protein
MLLSAVTLGEPNHLGALVGAKPGWVAGLGVVA